METSVSTAGVPIEGCFASQGFDKLGLGAGGSYDKQQTTEGLEHLQQTVALLEPRVHRSRKQIWRTQDEILRLVALYFVLQVALLLCVTYSSVLQCRSLWTPVSLSALSFIVTVRGLFQKYTTVGSLQHILSSEEHTLKVAVTRIYELRRKGPKYFESCNNPGGEYLDRRAKPAVIDIFVVLPLVAFSVIILASFWHMLCKS